MPFVYMFFGFRMRYVRLFVFCFFFFYRKLKSTAKALLNGAQIPEGRLEELRNTFRLYYTSDTVITEELLREAAETKTLYVKM